MIQTSSSKFIPRSGIFSFTLSFFFFYFGKLEDFQSMCGDFFFLCVQIKARGMSNTSLQRLVGYWQSSHQFHFADEDIEDKGI